jgi:hypothetical protein
MSPDAIVRERVAKWCPILLAGGNAKEMFRAGKAQVSADIRTDAPGDVDQGIKVLEQRLIAAVDAAQESHFVAEVRVRPDEKLGLNVDAKVAAIETEVDKSAAQLQGLTDAALAEIQRSLKELTE